MAVTIRLSRGGKKNDPRYSIVAIDKAKRRDGMNLEYLGTYNPNAKEAKDKIVLKKEAYDSWVAKGAIVSETIRRVLKAAARA
jgi:small subunit ribosomal protein S16